jgi:hypothetical protein
MHGAGATSGDTAAVLRARQADLFAYDPEQGRIRFDVDLMGFTVDIELDHKSLQ